MKYAAAAWIYASVECVYAAAALQFRKSTRQASNLNEIFVELYFLTFLYTTNFQIFEKKEENLQGRQPLKMMFDCWKSAKHATFVNPV